MSCGPLRRYVHRGRYSRVTVSTRPGREALYADFATHFAPHDLKCESEFMMGYRVVDGKRIALPAEPPDMEDGAEWYEPRAYCGGSAEWFKYGAKVAKWSGVVAIHCRNRPHVPKRNWSLANWVALVEALRGAGLAERIVCIGTRAAALAVPGCEDARALPLARQMDVLHSAAYAVGPSSGPMHLGHHSGCPVAVWCGGDKGERGATRRNYTSAWNPFRVPCMTIGVPNWRPPVIRAFGCVKRLVAMIKGKKGA